MGGRTGGRCLSAVQVGGSFLHRFSPFPGPYFQETDVPASWMDFCTCIIWVKTSHHHLYANNIPTANKGEQLLNGKMLFLLVQKGAQHWKSWFLMFPPSQGCVCVPQLRCMADNHFMSPTGWECYNSILMSKLNLFCETLLLKCLLHINVKGDY